MEQKLAEIRSEILDIFNHLHTNPERSWAEHNTTKYLQEILQREGYAPRTFSEHTGVVGEKGFGDMVVGLRADIDALWQEINGRWQANHSCGHDAHMTIVLGTIMLLNRLGFEPKGRLKIIFQPAEEMGTGALKMIEQEVIDDLDYLYGVHLRPIQELPSGSASPAIMHGAGIFIRGRIQGRQAHAARPHLGINTIEVGAALVQGLANIHSDPMVPTSIKMTRFSAGDKDSNIIPGEAEFSIDVRAQNNSEMNVIQGKFENIAQGIAKIYDADIHWQFEAEMPAAQPHPEAVDSLHKAIVKVLGESGASAPVVTSGGEDFHNYTQQKPELKSTMLGLGCDLKPGLHHPEMTFDHEALFTGIKIMTTAIIDTFSGK